MGFIQKASYPNFKKYEKIKEQVIKNVVTAFQGYAISDIKFNKDRPIAAAILYACTQYTVLPKNNYRALRTHL
jgi:hypothetical protein